MKIKVVFEKNGKVCEVRISEKMLRDIYDMAWYCLGHGIVLRDLAEENNIDVAAIIKKFGHFVHDILDEGKTYKIVGNKFVPAGKNYIFGRPKWKSKG